MFGSTATPMSRSGSTAQYSSATYSLKPWTIAISAALSLMAGLRTSKANRTSARCRLDLVRAAVARQSRNLAFCRNPSGIKIFGRSTAVEAGSSVDQPRAFELQSITAIGEFDPSRCTVAILLGNAVRPLLRRRLEVAAS